ncbi:helix-turn-helix transcriptional regulator [Agathobaculum sp. NTUH-O15-33]|uniref:helix-turn-helix domain-containing protein n=1 Tax=Agathobaculum sp. NTUH-O15-33 TaxID=3079302 RepID=UPI0029589B2B|nr:helix-turn-helix transcriptional regulator [Agathobaculum sp. NTUH-O15-33]WNX85760.1 helix-turn-helix transcriptional regulator [Agathobaculum sp. NTUH-O15-33]
MNNLRAARANDPRKPTQKEVAFFLGVDRSTYNKYETGDSEPNFDTICRLADYFGVSVEYLMGRTDKKKPPIPDGISGLSPKQIKILEMMDQMTTEQQDEMVRQAEYQLWQQQRNKDGR